MNRYEIDLPAYLAQRLGQMPTHDELADALGVSIRTSKRRKSDTYTLEDALRVIDYFELSRTEGLIELGILDARDVANAMGENGYLVDDTSTVVLAEEVARRLREEQGGGAEAERFPAATTVTTRPVNAKTLGGKQQTRQGAAIRKGLLD